MKAGVDFLIFHSLNSCKENQSSEVECIKDGRGCLDHHNLVLGIYHRDPRKVCRIDFLNLSF